MRLPVLAVLVCCSLAICTCPSRPVLAQSSPAVPAPTPQPLLSPRAAATAILPDATVTVDYGAPSMRGRVIFGGLVPYSEVWRTGANAATSFKTTGNLHVGSLTVPAGSYTLYSLPTADGWKLIVNKQTGQWGTVYDSAQDLGRIPMSIAPAAAPLETMVIDFEKTAADSTELHVKWANIDAAIPITAVK